MTTLQLLGMKHTGKSSIGRLWAQRQGWDFYDLDNLLEVHFGKGRTARQIFLEDGRTDFQRCETLAAKLIAGRLAQGRVVLAWGGGTITNPDAVEVLRPWGTSVVLNDRCEVLYERILRGGLPAFLSPEQPWDDFQALYRERSVLFESFTTHSLNLADASLEQAVDRLQCLWNTITPTGKS